MWLYAPVVSANQETEVGELLEPRRRRVQWAEIAPLHSSLGDKSETLSKNKKKESHTQNNKELSIDILPKRNKRKK